MARLLIQIQKPTVELKVISKDSAKSKDYILVGLKRYETEEAEAKADEFQTIVGKEGFNILRDTELDKFIKDSIVYIRNVSFDAVDTETDAIKRITVSDTRTAKPVETLWDTPDECLSALVDAYLKWASWRVSLISAVQTALIDMDISEDAVKNS